MKASGYQSLKQMDSHQLSADTVLDTIEKSGLRGLGGAGFPTASKLRIVRNEPSPVIFVSMQTKGNRAPLKTVTISLRNLIAF